MIFKGLDLDFDIFDAEVAEDYELALKMVEEASVTVKDEGLGDAIRRQCNAVFAFFDALFGDNFHKELFGDKTNLTDCVETFKAFLDAVDEQKTKLNSLLGAMGESPKATLPNRAERRRKRSGGV